MSFFYSGSSWEILLVTLGIIALLFTPFLIKWLYASQKYGWLTSFFLFIGFPAVFILFSGVSEFYFIPILSIPLGLFYVYCYFLRFTVRDWVSEQNAKNQLKFENKKRSAEKESPLNYFNHK